MKNEYYDPRRKTGWPMVYLPQDVGGISGEHVDWEPLSETHSSAQVPLFAPEEGRAAA